MTTDPARRRNRLAALHCARRDLGLDDGAYRDLLERVAGKRSAAELSDRQLDLVLGEMSRLGWQPTPKGAMRQGRTARGRYVRALWREVSRERSEASLQAMIRRQLGLGEDVLVDPDLLDPADCNVVIEALKAMARRAGIDPAAD
jgi:phage gp16-like protein